MTSGVRTGRDRWSDADFLGRGESTRSRHIFGFFQQQPSWSPHKKTCRQLCIQRIHPVNYFESWNLGKTRRFLQQYFNSSSRYGVTWASHEIDHPPPKVSYLFQKRNHESDERGLEQDVSLPPPWRLQRYFPTQTTRCSFIYNVEVHISMRICFVALPYVGHQNHGERSKNSSPRMTYPRNEQKHRPSRHPWFGANNQAIDFAVKIPHLSAQLITSPMMLFLSNVGLFGG